MFFLQSYQQSLTSAQIAKHLADLRKNADCQASHFAVAAIIEIFRDNCWYYFGGVNVEDLEQHRMTLHAEHNALTTAMAFLGPNIRISRVWVMAAPEILSTNTENPLGNNAAGPCGQCRQVLKSKADEKTEIISITLNGKIQSLGALDDLLPNAFSERDLGTHKKPAATYSSIFSSRKNRISLLDFINAPPFDAETLTPYLYLLNSNLLFLQTESTLPGLILRLSNGYFVPAVRCEDAAFLTVDPVYTALGQATSRFGKEQVCIEEIHLLGPKENPFNGFDEIFNASQRQRLQPYLQPGARLVVHQDLRDRFSSVIKEPAEALCSQRP